MKNYFKSNRFLFLGVVLLLIIFGFDLTPTRKASAMCEYPGRYPFWINIPNGRCLYSCYGDLVSCTCNPGYVPNPGCEDPETCRACVPSGTIFSPDLIASSPIPTAAPIGTAQVFSSTISNSGNASTGASFFNYFQTTNSQNPNSTNVTTYRVGAGILGAGQSTAISKGITFPASTPSTMYIRACADTGISTHYTGNTLNGDISEANASGAGETNNCSPWVSVAVGGTSTTMTGTLIPSAQHCTIRPDFNSCDIDLAWTINNPEAIPTAITANGMTNINVSNSLIINQSGTQTSVPVPYGGRTYYLYNNGIEPPLAQTTITADCADGNSFVDGVCTPNSTLPDLTASAPSPTTAVAGTAVNFSATISNAGLTAVPAGVKHVFEFDNDPNHNDGLYYDTTTNASEIAAEGSTTIYLQHVFNSNATNTPYTVYARVCADADERGPSDTGATGTIAESLENNNCGADWVTVNVDPTPPANGAACVSVSTPPSVARGNTFSATVVMKNTGTNTWKSVNLDSINPYRLGSQTPNDNLIWDLGRIELSRNLIAHGEDASFTFTAKAPTSPDTLPGTCDSLGNGSYSCSFDWGMLKENIAWFGEKCGKKITVTPSASPGDGACSSPAAHYTCASGSSPANVAGFPTKWTWTCVGSTSSVSCEEKKAPGYVEK